MPVNILDPNEISSIPSYKPKKDEKKAVEAFMDRFNDLDNYRDSLRANPYDKSKDSRTIEDTWDYADYVSLPHKYSNTDMEDWMANNSHPLIFEKIDTAISVLVAKNPGVEILARSEEFDTKAQILEKLYDISWDKGDGAQQLVKIISSCVKYGTCITREYHRFKKVKRKTIVDYDPELGEQDTEEEEIVIHDEPYLQFLDIRDSWIDNRAVPYNADSVRDWCWQIEYDYSTFREEFPDKRFPNAKFVQTSKKEDRDQNDSSDVISKPTVRVYFYENKENNEFIITDGQVLIHKGTLLNGKLSLVIFMWKMRHEGTIYGIGVPEMLENSQTLLDQISNMTINQIILSISGAGYYGGTGNVTESDMRLEPKLKKLRDADKIVFPKLPEPGNSAFAMIDMVKNEADEVSGITKSLGGEEVGKTLGEAVLNREAGLRRLGLSLKNIEFALEEHAQLRIDNIQRIYSRAERTQVVVDNFGNVIDDKLFEEYMDGKNDNPEDEGFLEKFPTNDNTGEVFRNEFKTERLPLEKDREGGIIATEQDKFMEVTPSEIRGEYDIKVKAMSTIPISKSLEESRALETFNIIAQLPYTDIYKAERNLLKARGQDPDDWMMSQDQIQQNQQQAQGAPPPEGGGMPEGMGELMQGGAPKLVPGNELEQPASSQGLSSQVSNSLFS